MGQYFIEQMSNCLNSFYDLYNRDEYISKRRYDAFLDKYKDIFSLLDKCDTKDNKLYQKICIIAQNGYNMINNKNQEFIKRHLIKDKEYFDSMFKKIDSNICLDEEQRKAILIDEDYSLIVAGAGSGKTTTMAAKVKYLIEKKNIKSRDIILLSFTNKATEELNHLLNEQFSLNVEVLTFHKLGHKFIRQILNAKPEIISDGGVYELLSKYFVEVVFPNKQKLKDYVECFSSFLYLDDSIYNFNSYDEYYNYFMDKKYNECQKNLKEEINRRILNRTKALKTINGEYVKSEAEVKIANYLYKNSIPYTYEKLFPYRLTDGRTYKPDFTVDNLGEEIYIEYYGLSTLTKENKVISENQKYQNSIFLKRKTHRKYKTNYIEIFGRYENGDYYLPKLSYNLKIFNVLKNLKDDKTIFYRLLETSKTMPYLNLIRFFSSFIGLYKEMGYDKLSFEELRKLTDDNMIKQQLYLLEDVFNYYEETLHTVIDGKVKIDFQDMIHYAYSKMNKLENKLSYKYVIIDEYQDISTQRYNFMKKISDLFHSKIVAVGDDWQTIYSFSGSDIELFTKFYESMGYAEVTTISNTYRNSQELIDLAGDFVLKNSFQLDKKLYSNKHLDKPVELVKYNYSDDYDNLPEILNKLIYKLYLSSPNDKILLLGRFNSELDNLLNSKFFYKNMYGDDKIICKSCPSMKIDFLTVHKSKGLGYDQVVILNGLNKHKGFPSQIKDHPVIKLIKNNDRVEDEIIEYPEERRLFYVALTRTKNKVYIMTPNNFDKRSDFIKEIENSKEVVVATVS
jgi:DNA helicase-4